MAEANDVVGGDTDPALLKVNGSRGKENDKEYVKKLANALTQTFTRHKVARLRCVGAAALSNADKAILIAQEGFAKNGITLVEKKSWTLVTFVDESGAKVEKTGILKEIVEYPK